MIRHEIKSISSSRLKTSHEFPLSVDPDGVIAENVMMRDLS